MGFEIRKIPMLSVGPLCINSVCASALLLSKTAGGIMARMTVIQGLESRVIPQSWFISERTQ